MAPILAHPDLARSRAPARLQRSEDGVLEVTLHTRGGSLVLDETTHRELPLLFSDIGNDPDTQVILLTGSGEDFCSELAGGDWDFSTPAGWDRTYWEGRRLMQNLLDIHVPMIGAINGPARVHAEIPVLCDVVLAADTVEFQDIAHFGSFANFAGFANFAKGSQHANLANFANFVLLTRLPFSFSPSCWGSS